MEQHKQAELPPLPPLTAEQIAEEEAIDRLNQIEEGERLALAEEMLARQGQESGVGRQESGSEIAASHSSEKSHPPTTHSTASAHNAHNDAPPESNANTDEPSTCGENGRPKKKSAYARMHGSAQTGRQSRGSRSIRRRVAPAVAELRLSPEQPVASPSG